jgi:RimJ/RimL family protein N-acetyltransferase
LLLMGHAFEALALERVAFRTDIRNERSQRHREAWCGQGGRPSA